MGKILRLHKHGMDFRKNEMLSDVGNYRVCTADYDVKCKDGNTYHLTFVTYNRWVWRTTHKITGRPLKTPIRELALENALHLSTCCIDENGTGRGNLLYNSVPTTKNYTYTLDDILKCVNDISAEKYTAVIIER